MEKKLMHPTELLKGTLQTIVLKVLADHGKMYGYEIAQRVKDLSERSIQLTEGALYPTLHKMEAAGLLETQTAFVGKRMRKYYTLTDEGGKAVEGKTREFKLFVLTMKHVLNLHAA